MKKPAADLKSIVMDEWKAADHHDHVLSEVELPLNNPLSKFRILTERVGFCAPLDLMIGDANKRDLRGQQIEPFLKSVCHGSNVLEGLTFLQLKD